jgi:hypothetical protein
MDDADALSGFNDAYWTAVLNPGEQTWPFKHLLPCVPGLPNAYCEKKVADARLRFAPYNLLSERPLLYVQQTEDQNQKKIDILFTTKFIYIADRAPFPLADGCGCTVTFHTPIHYWGILTINSEDYRLVGQLDTVVLTDFLNRLCKRSFTVSRSDVQILVKPASGNHFLESFYQDGVGYHGTNERHRCVLDLCRTTYPDERLLASCYPFWLSNRRLVCFRSGDWWHVPMTPDLRFRVMGRRENTPSSPSPHGSGHSPHVHLPHLHDKTIDTAVKLGAAAVAGATLLVQKYLKKQKEQQAREYYTAHPYKTIYTTEISSGSFTAPEKYEMSDLYPATDVKQALKVFVEAIKQTGGTVELLPGADDLS